MACDRCIADKPPTTEQLFLLDHTRHNASVGDIRCLWRAGADQADLPAKDFGIFDSRIVALLDFDDDDNLLNIELITAPAEVVRYSIARDAAMHLSDALSPLMTVGWYGNCPLPE